MIFVALDRIDNECQIVNSTSTTATNNNIGSTTSQSKLSNSGVSSHHQSMPTDDVAALRQLLERTAVNI